VHVQLGSWTDLACVTTVAVLAAACGGPSGAAGVEITWHTTGPVVVGEPVVADVSLRDAGGHPIVGATLGIEGHMSHPGMAPVLASAEDRGDGRYQVRFELTMAGDWIVLVRGALPDGRVVRHQVELANVQPSG
jgi:hypothetical protein